MVYYKESEVMINLNGGSLRPNEGSTAISKNRLMVANNGVKKNVDSLLGQIANSHHDSMSFKKSTLVLAHNKHSFYQPWPES